MKNVFYLLIFSTIVFASCKKDDNCDDTNLSTTIVGEWSVSALGFVVGDVEFKSDGTLIDVDDVLVGGEIGGQPLDEKSYTVNGNSSITVRAENNSGSLEFDFDVSEYSCEEISMDVSGIPASLDRK